MQYTHACSYLDGLQLFKVKLGLEAMDSFMASLGDPHTAYPCIHLAGTNGKGSVGAVLVNLLAASGYRVGFYSSPHLASVRERFRINHSCISREDFARITTEVKEKLGRDKVTYFEFTTALAFDWFHQERVDLAVIETGLGGRLDATNIIKPIVSVITSIDLDHQEYLGTTIEEIATEKAGIIKDGIPTVTGNLPQVAEKVMEQTCGKRRSPLFRYGKEFSTQVHDNSRFDYSGIKRTTLPNLYNGLIGAHQIRNTAVALAVLECVQDRFKVTDETINQFLPTVQWPGRMEPMSVTTDWGVRNCLLDGAHNQAGIEVLMDTLSHQYPRSRIFLIWGNMGDKNLGAAWHRLLDLAKLTIFAQAETKRSAKPEDLAAALPSTYHKKTKTAESVETALQTAFRESGGHDLIVIAGSLYLVGKIRPLLLETSVQHPI